MRSKTYKSPSGGKIHIVGGPLPYCFIDFSKVQGGTDYLDNTNTIRGLVKSLNEILKSRPNKIKRVLRGVSKNVLY